MTSRSEELRLLHAQLEGCRACPKMIGPVVHGPAVSSRVMLVGQAPGPREGSFGRPFAWTAGKTMFGWFERTLGIDEPTFRARVYMAAVARCFPGKAAGGGDRKPDSAEIASCERWLMREVAILRPDLVIAVGTLAIEQILQEKPKLAQVVGTLRTAVWHGRRLDVVALPHPSGASPWHKVDPGRGLLEGALELLGRHPAMAALLRS